VSGGRFSLMKKCLKLCWIARHVLWAGYCGETTSQTINSPLLSMLYLGKGRRLRNRIRSRMIYLLLFVYSSRFAKDCPWYSDCLSDWNQICQWVDREKQMQKQIPGQKVETLLQIRRTSTGSLLILIPWTPNFTLWLDPELSFWIFRPRFLGRPGHRGFASVNDCNKFCTAQSTFASIGLEGSTGPAAGMIRRPALRCFIRITIF
jgi:hypothetical protein